jgi:hypothetical protein
VGLVGVVAAPWQLAPGPQRGNACACSEPWVGPGGSWCSQLSLGSETSFTSCPSPGERSCWKPGPRTEAGEEEQEQRRFQMTGSGTERRLLAPSSSGEALGPSYTSQFMMLNRVLEPAERRTVTASATGSRDVSPSVRKRPPKPSDPATSYLRAALVTKEPGPV